MNLTIIQRGGEKGNLSIYEDAIYFFANKLLKIEDRKNIKIKIVFTKNINYTLKNTMGWHRADNSLTHTIFIDRNISFRDILITLAHEMVHVKQAVQKTLLCTTKGMVWKGKLYDNNYLDEYYTKPYEVQKKKLPWEKEALNQESRLAKAFINSLFDT